MVQISPSNTVPQLTSRLLRRVLQPATYHHRLAYLTYYRVTTTDFMEGPAGAVYLKEKLHASTYFAVHDTLAYGAGLSREVQAYAAKIGVRLVGSAHLDPKNPSSIASSSERVSDLVAAKHPDAVFYAGDSTHLGAPFVRDLRRKGYAGPVVGGEPLHSVDFIRLTANGAMNTYASEMGFAFATTSKSFRASYQRRFHTPQQQYDAPAYDAANITLHAVYRAATLGAWRGSRLQLRAAVLPYVAHVRWHGATGITSFDHNGDNRHVVISMYRTRNGRWVFAGVAPPVRGVSPTG